MGEKRTDDSDGDVAITAADTGKSFQLPAARTPDCMDCCMHPGLHGLLHAPRTAWTAACTPDCMDCCMHPRLHGLLHSPRTAACTTKSEV